MRRKALSSVLPRHIAIIPDGNRRWGKSRHISANQSHQKGAENFREIFREAFRSGIPWITFWAASEDNLVKRSRTEVFFLANLLAREISSKKFETEVTENKVSVRFLGIGDRMLHNKKLSAAIRAIEKKTAGFTTAHLTILFGYDGRREMTEAIETLIHSHAAANDKTLRAALWTGFLPPVDLVLRTGEEDLGWSHWSAGFMMWHVAQAEFYTTGTFWPEFSTKDFHAMLYGYAGRARRLGK
jgi:undecaprenyl diphosphate synthase